MGAGFNVKSWNRLSVFVLPSWDGNNLFPSRMLQFLTGKFSRLQSYPAKKRGWCSVKDIQARQGKEKWTRRQVYKLSKEKWLSNIENNENVRRRDTLQPPVRKKKGRKQRQEETILHSQDNHLLAMSFIIACIMGTGCEGYMNTVCLMSII